MIPAIKRNNMVDEHELEKMNPLPEGVHFEPIQPSSNNEAGLIQTIFSPEQPPLGVKNSGLEVIFVAAKVEEGEYNPDPDPTFPEDEFNIPDDCEENCGDDGE